MVRMHVGILPTTIEGPWSVLYVEHFEEGSTKSHKSLFICRYVSGTGDFITVGASSFRTPAMEYEFIGNCSLESPTGKVVTRHIGSVTQENYSRFKHLCKSLPRPSIKIYGPAYGNTEWAAKVCHLLVDRGVLEPAYYNGHPWRKIDDYPDTTDWPRREQTYDPWANDRRYGYQSYCSET